jgi:hypothetical protein
VKNTVVKILEIGLGLAVLCVLIWLIPVVNTALHPKHDVPESPTTTTTETETPEEINVHTTAKIRQTLLDYYQVREFPEILYQDANNLLGYLVDITATDPNMANGEFTLHFSNSWNTTSQSQAKKVAENAMRIVGAKIPEVNAIWARFDTYAGKIYYNERAGKEVFDGK